VEIGRDSITSGGSWLPLDIDEVGEELEMGLEFRSFSMALISCKQRQLEEIKFLYFNLDSIQSESSSFI
jgi:hypothetical protein